MIDVRIESQGRDLRSSYDQDHAGPWGHERVSWRGQANW